MLVEKGFLEVIEVYSVRNSLLKVLQSFYTGATGELKMGGYESAVLRWKWM